MKILKYITLIVSIAVCLLWYFNPSTNWEPIFVILALLFQAVLEHLDKKNQKKEIESYKNQFISVQTGGETFSYIMLYNFSLDKNWARDFVIIKEGHNSLYNLSYRIVNYLKSSNNTIIPDTRIGEISSPAVASHPIWMLEESNHYGIFFNARNGSWTQELILKKSIHAECWLAATQVTNRKGQVIYTYTDSGYEPEFGRPNWKRKNKL